MTEQQLLQSLRQQPGRVQFNDVLAVIDANYRYTPTAFSNGIGSDTLRNEAGSNEGSCRVFAFALLHGLDEAQTLHCFGDVYRVDVLGNPAGEDHRNIRNFIRFGWSGIRFDNAALQRK